MTLIGTYLSVVPGLGSADRVVVGMPPGTGTRNQSGGGAGPVGLPLQDHAGENING